MGRAHDNKILSEIRRRIIENPRKDYDDELFYAIMRSVWLCCSVYTDDMVAEDHGKKYLAVHIEGKGKEVPLKRILLDFTDRYLMLDGISLDGLLIEKGFIEEIISGIDQSTMTAIADDISSYETDATAVADEALQSFPGIQKWNTDAVLTTPLVKEKDNPDFVSRLSRTYKNILDRTRAAGYRTLSVSPLSDNLSREGDVAASSVNIWIAMNPDYPISVTFILPSESALQSFLSPS